MGSDRAKDVTNDEAHGAPRLPPNKELNGGVGVLSPIPAGNAGCSESGAFGHALKGAIFCPSAATSSGPPLRGATD